MAGRVRQHDVEQRIVAAGLRLFAERGFDRVAMHEIAAAADVSRRTVYRHFPTKGHVVLAVPTRWLAVWDEVVAAAVDDAPVTVAESASLAVASYIDDHPVDVLTAYAALAESPSLESAGTMHHAWIDRIVALLGRETDPEPPATQHVVAGAYMGAIDALLAHWVRGGGTGSVRAATESALVRLRPIWPASGC